ncbi:hypothetical protein UA08_05019 [Talaromyces atroroseus]|uniref:DUF1365 domain-containing protein n=1 Tax=Talaromyces atroroseus TaxID=1441469 RepID=A0A225AR04_TALAT|nr:hypothetical protein UA08_05019 [Talaromyces atroroseus]OKL59688.1 hypothetical protein UA08_05019 [Talaromyces atroroseus]
MTLTDLVLAILYVGHHSANPALWTKAVSGGAILLLSAIVASLLLMLARAVFAPRKLVSLNDDRQTVLGKPLLFPVRFRHIRLSPVKDRFNNRFLLVGVPVGLRCRIGNLLAIDDKSLDVSPPPGSTIGFSWNRMFSHLRCWFSFDSARFLHRGDHGVDLREKLDSFLLSQNEDPTQWPYAYLLGVPQFMGWSRSVVSWWYLYTKDRELDALILEINNSYWEKRNILLRVKPTSNKLNMPESTGLPEYVDHRQLVQSLPTATKAKFYGGDWHKYIFASPFEKVDGVVSQRMMDPLRPSSWAPDATFSNMTTLEETGEVRMATRLTCDGFPIDPTQMSYLDVVRVALQWTLPGVLTTPEIIYKAELESYFRAYLAHSVDTYPEPVEVTYLPCRSFTNETIRMRSPSCYVNEATNARYLTVEPTDPAFYTRIITYVHAKTALAQEIQPTGHIADPTAQRLIVSDITLLESILEYKSPFVHKSDPNVPSKWKLRKVLSLTRDNSTLSFMDNFVLSSSNAVPYTVYILSSLRLSAARRLAFNSQNILGVYVFVASCLIRWLALEALSVGRETVLPVLSLGLPPGWQNLAIAVVECFLALNCLTLIENWLVQQLLS